MLQLYFNFNGHLLKVRQKRADETFAHSVCWKNRVEFSVLDSTVLMMAWTSILPDLRKKDAEALCDLASARYPLSHDYEELGRLCPELMVAKETDEWVFYGGSFNPWHEGHQACLNLLPEGKFCFVLPDHSPHKELRQLDSVSTLIEIAHKAKFKKNQFLVPTFLLETKKNPTVDWIERLARQYPEKKLSLLMGFDSLKSLNSWTRAQDLLPHLHRIYVAPRLETDADRNLAASTIIGPEIVFLDHHAFENISSTSLRNK